MYLVKVNMCTVYKWTYVQCTSELLYSVRFNIYKVYNSPVTCTVQSLISSQAPQPFPTTAPHTWQEAGGRRQEAGGRRRSIQVYEQENKSIVDHN